MPIIPSLRYADPNAAIAFFEQALGFTRHVVHEDGEGGVAHAQLRLGDDWVMLSGGGDDRFPSAPTTLYIPVEDPDAAHARAVGAGAEIVMGLTDQDYGSREFAAKDPAGNVWCLGTYVPS